MQWDEGAAPWGSHSSQLELVVRLVVAESSQKGVDDRPSWQEIHGAAANPNLACNQLVSRTPSFDSIWQLSVDSWWLAQ